MKYLQIIGHLGMDATINEDNGKKQVRFSVAVNDNYKDQNGNKVERTDWISIFYNGLNLAQYLKKGTKLFVGGDMTTRVYKDRDGNWRAGTTINANKIQLLSSVAKDEPSNSNTPAPPAGSQVPDDDLPF